MNLTAKLEKELPSLIVGLIEKHEAEKNSVGKFIHGDICTLLALVKMILSKHSKKAENPETFNEIFSLLNESLDKLKLLSNDLNPSLLKLLGLMKTIDSYNQKQTQTKGVTIRLENTTTNSDNDFFEYYHQLIIFRAYCYILNYFFEILVCTELAIKISNDTNYFTLEFITINPSTFDLETKDVIISQLLKKELTPVEALLLILNANIDEDSDMISFIKIAIPIQRFS